MKLWRGSKITTCQVCPCTITESFVDGRVKGAGWAIMCPSCFRDVGVGLGDGNGQGYCEQLVEGELKWAKMSDDNIPTDERLRRNENDPDRSVEARDLNDKILTELGV